MEQIPNYKNRKTKKRNKILKKILIFAILLMISKSIANVSADIIDQITYNKLMKEYFETVYANFYNTDDHQHKFLKTENIAQEIKKFETNDEREFYHHLIGVAQYFKWNVQDNFDKLLVHLNLNELDKENSKYPSEAEFRTFLEEYKLIKEDGTIDFEKWEKNDKSVTLLEEKIKEGGKNK